jgi:probable HAF family extracellular repeat protein
MSSRIKIPLFIKKITKIDLGTLPGGTSSTAFDINSAGQIVGEGTSASGITHGFLISGANRFDLSGNPNGPCSSARGINNLGHVVGVREVINSAGKSVHHGFVRENDVMRDLGAYPPNDKDNSWSHADRINDNGLIAGCIEIFGVVWDLSGAPDFPPFPPFVLVTDKFGARPSCTYDINNSGQSVGGGFRVRNSVSMPGRRIYNPRTIRLRLSRQLCARCE